MLQKLIAILSFVCCFNFTFAQSELPNLFINCQIPKCHTDYLTTELSIFNFVRDQASADVIVMITNINNGAGGKNYRLFFEGQNKLRTQKDTLEFSLRQDATDELIRKKILNTISLGLLEYLDQQTISEQVKVNFTKTNRPAHQPKKDKWNNWIFGMGASGQMSGESNRRNLSTNLNFRGGRTTEKLKYSFNSYYVQRNNSVRVDSVFNTVRVNDYGFNSLLVKSFSNHWSIGGFVKGFHSVYQNIEFSKSAAPAVEYSFFPFNEFTRRQLRCIYQAGVRDFNYMEKTVFDKTKETLPYQQLTGILGFTQNWGNFSAELSGYQYLHNTDLYRLSLELDLNLRVAEGLSIRFYGYGSQINNQISLPKQAGDTANVLLGGRQLATSFSYNTSFGINYTFGSVNNSIVNPRFSGVN